jgi:hypothetical protein
MGSMMADFKLRRVDEFGKRTDIHVVRMGNGDIIVATTDPDHDVTSIIISREDAIALMEWLSEVTR